MAAGVTWGGEGVVGKIVGMKGVLGNVFGGLGGFVEPELAVKNLVTVAQVTHV